MPCDLRPTGDDPRCDCGAWPSPNRGESPTTGFYTEGRILRFICYRCWCKENYGADDEPGIVVPIDAPPQEVS